MTPDIQAWLLSQVGADTPAADLEARYTRLGSARAVALEVLRERHSALLASPSTVSVPGAVNASFVENIRAYERKIALLEAGEPPAPDEPTDPDGDGDGGFGVLYLVERNRR
ncbi:hypothetical protein [Streptomyces sp. NEAU-H3]|uniref:hypothetical protein n=1 Tax=Streptomyces sp. NEAU-H3 TaxID=2720636 RepID=UPI00143BBA13|nr:hypothetical protein [Streptomyces sp. NEAU-H3]NJA59399.1 hypothetical protein [Streptomyces sp. NEAU-H3]